MQLGMGITILQKIQQADYVPKIGTQPLDLFMDPGSQQYWLNGSTSLAALMTDNHAGSIWVEKADGGFAEAGNDALTRSGLGYQVLPTRTNKCANDNANPVDLSSFYDGANAPIASGYVSLANDSAALAASGLAGICASGTVIEMTVPAGAASGDYIIQPSGQVGNTDEHAISICARKISGGSDTFRLGVAGQFADRVYGPGYARCQSRQTPGSSILLMAFGVTHANGTETRARFTLNQLEEGEFATPPIVVSGSPVTRGGNQPVIAGLGTVLADGFSGYVKLDVRDAGSNYVRLLDFNDGSNGSRISLIHNGGSLVADVYDGGSYQGGTNLGGWPDGDAVLAFAAAQDFFTARIVGNPPSATDTSLNYPTMDRLAFGSQGFAAGQNAYCIVREIGIMGGVQDAGSFAGILALAEARAAA